MTRVACASMKINRAVCRWDHVKLALHWTLHTWEKEYRSYHSPILRESAASFRQLATVLHGIALAPCFR
jgi:hypothetical protein